MSEISDLFKLLAELKAERALIEDTILTLQRLVVKRGMASPIMMKQAVVGGPAKREQEQTDAKELG